MLSATFHILPASTNNAPFIGPINGNRYSKFVEIFRFASLNSLLLLLVPGPSLYAFHALLSFAPPAKYDLEKGILIEFPIGIAIPPKNLNAKIRSLAIS